MPIRFRCPHCKKPLQVKDHLAGKKGTCPTCKKGVVIPSAPAPSTSATVPPAADSVPVSSLRWSTALYASGKVSTSVATRRLESAWICSWVPPSTWLTSSSETRSPDRSPALSTLVRTADTGSRSANACLL